jgi:hypothetical protein
MLLGKDVNWEQFRNCKNKMLLYQQCEPVNATLRTAIVCYGFGFILCIHTNFIIWVIVSSFVKNFQLLVFYSASLKLRIFLFQSLPPDPLPTPWRQWYEISPSKVSLFLSMWHIILVIITKRFLSWSSCLSYPTPSPFQFVTSARSIMWAGIR